jgi:peroxiredoxin family protein
LANGAASSGKKVTLFFTFWGLNIIKKAEKPSVKKDIVSRMFEMTILVELNLTRSMQCCQVHERFLVR